MAHGFRGMPVQLEVTACDGKIGGDGQLFAGPESEQGAIVANAEAEAAARGPGCAAANLAQERQFAWLCGRQ